MTATLTPRSPTPTVGGKVFSIARRRLLSLLVGVVGVLGVLGALGTATPCLAATLTVTSTGDSAADTGSLRYALGAAQSGDTIVFDLPNPSTIGLSNGVLEIKTNVLINGPGASSLAVSGMHMSSVFLVDAGVTTTLSGLTIENGNSAKVVGGGIVNSGTLTISDSIVSGNNVGADSANTFGGGIGSYPGASLTLIHSTVTGNTNANTFYTNAYGAGIGDIGGVATTIIDSVITGNYFPYGGQGGGQGAGIATEGTLTVINSTVSDGIGANGAIYCQCTSATIIGTTVSSLNGFAISSLGPSSIVSGPLTLTNSTVYASGSGDAAIKYAGPVTLLNSTVSTNSIGIDTYYGGTLTMKGTIVTGGKGYDCVFAPGSAISSSGYNIDDDGSCGLNQPGDQSNVTKAASYLGPLQNNGGLTQTVALLPGSSAIDAIPPSACTDLSGHAIATDQRGIGRPVGKGCDIGAYEVATANVCPAGQGAPAPCSYTASSSIPIPLGTTLGSNPVQVVTQGLPNLDFTLAGAGTTCTAGLAGPAVCTVEVNFVPLAPGLRTGAISLLDNNGNTVVTGLIGGVGHGPAIAFGPGAQHPLSAVVSNPAGLAVDAAGNLFIADSGTGSVVEIQAGTGNQITVEGGLTGPSAVAVDGAGNLFVAESGSNTAVKIPYLGSASYGTPITVASGFDLPYGVAVDAAGNLFIADTFNSRVVEVPANGSASTTVGSGLSQPFGVAVDGAGNLFIADTGNGRVVEVPANGGTQTTIGTGLTSPQALAVDAAGDVFIADTGNSRVVEVPAGCTSASCQIAVGGGIPVGLALDAAGDVFVSYSNSAQVVELNRSQTAFLSFAPTLVGSTSSDSPQSVVIQNIGNQPLMAVAPGLVVSGSSFAQVAGPGIFADCASSFSLTPGALCNLSIAFTPQSGGLQSGSAAFTDNTLNTQPSATQSLLLLGSGTLPTPTITFSITGTYATGQSLQVSATSNSAGAITYSLVSGPATVSASGLVTITGPGMVTIKASQAATSTYGPATQQASFTATQAKSTTTLIASLVKSGYSSAAALSATVSPQFSGTPSGSVTFYDGSTALATVTLAGGKASYATGELTGGEHSFTAAYAGDTNFLGSTSSAATVDVPVTAVSLQLLATSLVYPLPPAFDVHVSPASGAAAPTGTVTIYDGSAAVGTYKLSAQAKGYLIGLVLPPLNVGTHPLTAVYSGDANYPPGTSTTVVVTVTPGPTNLTLICANTKLKAGQTLTCTVNVEEGILPVTGTVTYTVSGWGSATVTLNSSGRATISYPAQNKGSFTITATYNAQGNYRASNSASVSYTVN